MQHSDFQIGTEFFTAAGRWRCTDVGTRVIVAISLEPRETVRLWTGAAGERVQETFISDDPRDLIGPPYSVAELVFDEYDLDGCSTCADDLREFIQRHKQREIVELFGKFPADTDYDYKKARQ